MRLSETKLLTELGLRYLTGAEMFPAGRWQCRDCPPLAWVATKSLPASLRSPVRVARFSSRVEICEAWPRRPARQSCFLASTSGRSQPTLNLIFLGHSGVRSPASPLNARPKTHFLRLAWVICRFKSNDA